MPTILLRIGSFFLTYGAKILKNPKILAIIVGVLVVVGGAGYIWYALDSRNNEIESLNRSISEANIENERLSNVVENKEKIIENMKIVARETEEINKSIREEFDKGERRRQVLSEKLDAIDIKELYRLEPKKSNDVVNNTFKNRIDCLQSAANDTESDAC